MNEYQDFIHLADPDLLPKYWDGNNQLPFYWVQDRYSGHLYLLARGYLQQDSERAWDIMNQVIDALRQASGLRRRNMLKLINERVLSSLKAITRNKSIDLFRRDSKTLSIEPDQLVHYLEERQQTSFFEELAQKDLYEQMLKIFERKHGETELELLLLIQKYQKDLDGFAAAAGVSKSEARVIKQRIKRYVLRILNLKQ